MAAYDEFSVTHGLGYSTFVQAIEQIRSTLTVCVAPDDPVEVDTLTLVNLSGEARRLDVTLYAEWLLGFAPDEHREFHKLFITTEADVEQRAVFARK